MKNMIKTGLAALIGVMPFACDTEAPVSNGPEETPITVQEKTPMNVLCLVAPEFSKTYLTLEDSVRVFRDPCKTYRENYEEANAEVHDSMVVMGNDTFFVRKGSLHCMDSTMDSSYMMTVIKPLDVRIRELNAITNLDIGPQRQHRYKIFQ